MCNVYISQHTSMYNRLYDYEVMLGIFIIIIIYPFLYTKPQNLELPQHCNTLGIKKAQSKALSEVHNNPMNCRSVSQGTYIYPT